MATSGRCAPCSHEVRIQKQPARGYTALMAAVTSGNRAVVELLLTRGADPMATADGKTARDMAADRDDGAILAVLDSRQGACPGKAKPQ